MIFPLTFWCLVFLYPKKAAVCLYVDNTAYLLGGAGGSRLFPIKLSGNHSRTVLRAQTICFPHQGVVPADMLWEGFLENRPRRQEWLLLIDAKVNAEKVERGEAPLFEGELEMLRMLQAEVLVTRVRNRRFVTEVLGF